VSSTLKKQSKVSQAKARAKAKQSRQGNTISKTHRLQNVDRGKWIKSEARKARLIERASCTALRIFGSPNPQLSESSALRISLGSPTFGDNVLRMRKVGIEAAINPFSEAQTDQN